MIDVTIDFVITPLFKSKQNKNKWLHKLFKSKYIFITKFKKYPKRIDAEDVTLTFYAFYTFQPLELIQNIVIVEQRATIKSIDEYNII